MPFVIKVQYKKYGKYMSKNTIYTSGSGAHPNGRGPMIFIPQTLFFLIFFFARDYFLDPPLM